MRVANLVMSVLFLFSAAVQVNDPDPIRWMAIYLAAVALSAWWGLSPPRGPGSRALPFVLAGIALIWAAAIVSHTSGYVELPRLFESWEMQNRAVEEYRETYGLLIVAAWMIVAGARPRARSR